MFKDPKQFLLLHGEKVVFVAMLLLLVLVIWAYHPWSVSVDQESRIRTNLQGGVEALGGSRPEPIPQPPSHLQDLEALLGTPWMPFNAPALYRYGDKNGEVHLIFADAGSDQVVQGAKRPEKDPPVRPIETTYAKADKERVIVVFRIDDAAQRKTLVNAGMGRLDQGLQIERIVILRYDDRGGEPVEVTPKDENWLPAGVAPGSRYGEVGTDAGSRSMLSPQERVYIFAQARPPEGPDEGEMRRRMEERRRMEAEARKQAEEMLKKQREAEEARRKAEAERRGGVREDTRPKPPRKDPRRRRDPRRRDPKRLRAPAVDATKAGYHHFVDSERLDPARTYRYKVIIYCRNPIKNAANGIVQSHVGSTDWSNEAKVQSFKEWYFTGGATDPEFGNFRIRCYIGGSKEITPEKINRIVQEMEAKRADGGAGAVAKGPGDEEGIWVEQTDTVRPGEEIGYRQKKQDREIDFSTGCQVVAIEKAVRVVEEKQTVRKAVDGEMKSVEVLRRRIYPDKLRVSYIDAHGKLQTRWLERAPALIRASAK